MRKLLLVLGPVVLGIAACQQQAPPSPAAAGIGTTIAVDPAATIQAQVAALQAPVHMNDLLETGADGAIRVQFVDTTFFSLGASSRVTIDKFVFDPDRGASQVSLAVAKGAFRFVSGKPLHASPGQPAITTPVAAIGIRGTGVSGIVGPEAEALFREIDPGYAPDGGDVSQATLILLTDGAIDVTGSGVTEVLDRPGQVLFFRRPGAPPIGPVFAWSERRARIIAMGAPPSLGPEPNAPPPAGAPPAASPVPAPTPTPTPSPAATRAPEPVPTPTAALPTPEPSVAPPLRRPPWVRPTPGPAPRPSPTFRPPLPRFTPVPTPRPTYRPPVTRVTPVPTPRPTYRPPVTRFTPVPTPRPTYRPPATRYTPVPTPQPTYRPPVTRYTPKPAVTPKPTLSRSRLKPAPSPSPKAQSPIR